MTTKADLIVLAVIAVPLALAFVLSLRYRAWRSKDREMPRYNGGGEPRKETL